MDSIMTSSPLLADAEHFDVAAARISVPRVEPGDSFILHAPLELLARNGLLTLASPEGREAILDRMNAIAATYNEWGTPLDRVPTHSEALIAEPVGVLADAVLSGDAEAADDAITWLAAHLDTEELVRSLAGPIMPSLAAAAHGPILLYLLPRVAARSLDAASLARTTVHELVRRPEWRLTWFEAGPLGGVDQHPDPERELTRRLAAPRLSEQPQNTFIYPTMSTTERTGLARDTLADLYLGLSVPAARRSLLRSAAQSMLQDDANEAPYGWSHCLTMPQAALGVAHAMEDPSVAVAVAATYVLGFRAALGSTELDPTWVPDPVEVDLREIIDATPDAAAAAAWHAPVERRPEWWRTLATNAGAHPDAHLAKYTLACLDATRADPDAHGLFLAAAAFLNAWWRTRG